MTTQHTADQLIPLAAMQVITHAREMMMTKIIDKICAVLDAIDAHDALVRKLNAQLDQPAA